MPETLYLASGLQSGGTTLVSWCFLQRADMDGVLDQLSDYLVPLPRLVSRFAWCKTTVSSFRWQDVADFHRWQGLQVRPLLLVCDVRYAYASLRTKVYGRESLAAEEPPLRLRMTRFLHDWEQFRAHGWPVLRYESLLERPRETLQAACAALDLAWDEAMLDWPKRPADIADSGRGNASFWGALGPGLEASLRPRRSGPVAMARDDLDWLEETFAGYNRTLDYPAHLGCTGGGDAATDYVPGPRHAMGARIDALQAHSHALQARLDNCLIHEGRLLASLLNAFPHPRRMLRAVRYRLAKRDADPGTG